MESKENSSAHKLSPLVVVAEDEKGESEHKVQVTYFASGENKDEEDEEIHRCGLGPCFSPEWLQVFASKKAFMIVFSMLAVIQGMSWSYFTATITTLEKRFKISSQTAGIVMTGNEISQILFSIVLSYYGGKGHRPRWIAFGVMFSALSAFVLASPHAFFGPGNDALSMTEEYAKVYDPSWEPVTTTTTTINPFSELNSSISNSMGKSGRGQIKVCKPLQSNGGGWSDCDSSDSSIAPLVLIFISQFIMGIGVLLFFSLGGPYLDDNIEKTKSPMLFGITMSLRLIGPILGFLFAAGCLKVFIAPTLTPLIQLGDPRWLGAWWLGWMILGTLMLITSFTIAMFPRELPRAAMKKKMLENMKGSQASLARMQDGISTAEKANENALKFSEIPHAVSVLLRNKINLFNNAAGIFYLFSAIGYWTFMPKYLETIFMQTAVSASAISGVVSIAFQSIGLLLSGWLISKYQPSARMLAGWNVFLGVLYVFVKISFTRLGCQPGIPNFGERDPSTGVWNLSVACNEPCNCKTNKIQPVCWTEKSEIFYSACHAGCTTFEGGFASNCSCLPDPDIKLAQGTCNQDCATTFMIFLGINAIIKLLDSSGRIGNMLVSYRCVDPKDKSLAIGLGIFLISIFAMLPAPILFGKIFDSVCLVWGSKCSQRGNCWLYDGERLRYLFNLTAAGFTAVGAFFDILVWYYVKDLDLYDEDKNIRNRLTVDENESNKTYQQYPDVVNGEDDSNLRASNVLEDSNR